jgi:hypothetical protein
MRDKGLGKLNGNGSARGAMSGAEGAKAKSRPYKDRNMEGGKLPSRHGKVGPKGAPSKSAGSKKSSQARKSRR